MLIRIIILFAVFALISCEKDEEDSFQEQENKILVFNSSSSYQRVFGLDGEQVEFKSIKEVEEGYLVVGHDMDRAIVHLMNSDGEISKKLGGSLGWPIDFAEDLKITGDGGFICTGRTRPGDVRLAGWVSSLRVIKANHDYTWDWTYNLTAGPSSSSNVHKFLECEVTSNGYWVIGRDYNHTIGDLTNVSVNGHSNQHRNWGNLNDIHVFNGNELVGCGSNSTPHLPVITFDLLFLNSHGDSTKMLVNLDESSWNSIEVTSSNIVVGGAKNGIGVIRVYDLTGNVLWTKELHTEGVSNVLDVKEAHDGNLVFSATNGLNAKILKLNISSQQTQWIREFNGGHQTLLYEVQPTSDGGYVAAGYSQYGLNKFGYLVKIDANGN